MNLRKWELNFTAKRISWYTRRKVNCYMLLWLHFIIINFNKLSRSEAFGVRFKQKWRKETVTFGEKWKQTQFLLCGWKIVSYLAEWMKFFRIWILVRFAFVTQYEMQKTQKSSSSFVNWNMHSTNRPSITHKIENYAGFHIFMKFVFFFFVKRNLRITNHKNSQIRQRPDAIHYSSSVKYIHFIYSIYYFSAAVQIQQKKEEKKCFRILKCNNKNAKLLQSHFVCYLFCVHKVGIP